MIAASRDSIHVDSARNDRDYNNYYKEVGRTRPLDSGTERKLFILYRRRGNLKARDMLISNCLRFVVKLARRFTQDTNAVKELIAAGNEGVMLALSRYDLKRNTRFLSYATYWILLCMRNELHNRPLVRMPFWRQKAVRKIRQAQSSLELRGIVTSVKQISEATDLSQAQVTRLQNVTRLKFFPFVPLASNSPADVSENQIINSQSATVVDDLIV